MGRGSPSAPSCATLSACESASRRRGAGHGYMCGSPTTMKEASSVPVKRSDVERDRGWRWGGMGGGRRSARKNVGRVRGWENWSLGRGVHRCVSHAGVCLTRLGWSRLQELVWEGLQGGSSANECRVGVPWNDGMDRRCMYWFDAGLSCDAVRASSSSPSRSGQLSICGTIGTGFMIWGPVIG